MQTIKGEEVLSFLIDKDIESIIVSSSFEDRCGALVNALDNIVPEA
jgi:hypothetical protein